MQAKPFPWMLDVVWLNIVELSKHEPFTALLDKVRSLARTVASPLFIRGAPLARFWGKIITEN